MANRPNIIEQNNEPECTKTTTIGRALVVLAFCIALGCVCISVIRSYRAGNLFQPVNIVSPSSLDAPSGNPDSATTIYSTGQTIDVDDKQIAVLGVERDYQPAQPGFATHPGCEFVRVTVSITNNAKTSTTYNNWNFFVEQDDRTLVYHDLATMSDPDELGYGNLGHGENVVGSVIFEIPADNQRLILHYIDDFNSESETLIRL